MNHVSGGAEPEDILTTALRKLADTGVQFCRSPEPFLRLYTAPGFPELTSGQVISIARQRGLV